MNSRLLILLAKLPCLLPCNARGDLEKDALVVLNLAGAASPTASANSTITQANRP